MILPLFSLIAISFVISWGLTLAMKHLSPRIGFVDKPGHRKIHANPKPLGGGVAIYWGFALPVLLGLWIFPTLSADAPARTTTFAPTPAQFTAFQRGVTQQTPLALAFLGSCFVLHVMGLLDDRKAMGPYIKLVIQLAVTTGVVVFGELRALTAVGYVPSVMLTVLWITGVTNAFNFLDNMDGLSAGVAAVATAAFLVAALSIQQWFVAATLALFLGSLLGFLCFNFSPASIFMGDSGSLVIGFILGILTVRTTFLPPERSFANGWYAIFAPVIVLALPLYDLVVVSLIRLSKGKSPFQGDTNHFSHRLVARGMSKRTAVLCLYLVTAATSIAAIVLPHVSSTFAAMLIVAQTLLILGVVMLLEQHSLPVPPATNE